jgi:hypothetical protein
VAGHAGEADLLKKMAANPTAIWLSWIADTKDLPRYLDDALRRPCNDCFHCRRRLPRRRRRLGHRRIGGPWDRRSAQRGERGRPAASGGLGTGGLGSGSGALLAPRRGAPERVAPGLGEPPQRPSRSAVCPDDAAFDWPAAAEIVPSGEQGIAASALRCRVRRDGSQDHLVLHHGQRQAEPKGRAPAGFGQDGHVASQTTDEIANGPQTDTTP